MELTENEITKFNFEYQKGIDRMKGIVILEAYRPKGINIFEKIRAKKSISHFENALSIVPEHFQSLFFLGKIYQRLKDYEKSLFYLEKSMEIEKENYSIPQEASLVAMHLNQINKAIEYSEESLKRKPDSFALLGNHSMNLLIAGKDIEAKEFIEKAIIIEPNDEINKRIKSKIINVIEGKIKRPTFKESI